MSGLYVEEKLLETIAAFDGGVEESYVLDAVRVHVVVTTYTALDGLKRMGLVERKDGKLVLSPRGKKVLKLLRKARRVAEGRSLKDRLRAWWIELNYKLVKLDLWLREKLSKAWGWLKYKAKKLYKRLEAELWLIWRIAADSIDSSIKSFGRWIGRGSDSKPEKARRKAWAKCVKCGRKIPEGELYFFIYSIDGKKCDYSLCAKCFAEMVGARSIKIQAWSRDKKRLLKEVVVYEKSEGEK